MATRHGIDYAWHEPITDSVCTALRKAGVTFVGRYFSNNTDSKNLTRPEAQVLSRNGIDIICFWESTATEAENGFNAGVADAKRALEEANACGMPEDRPIYFAIDADVTVGPNISAYFKGVASVLGLHRTGAYGGFNVIKALFNKKLIRWGFQTYAWSGGKWVKRAQFRQYSNGHTVAGISCDYDVAVARDFGQWRLGAPRPRPVPAPKPPKDVCGHWPFGADDYIAEQSTDQHCHDGTRHRDHLHVRRFQAQLAERGHHITPTGYCNRHTVRVIRHFQRQAGIPVTGRADHRTWHHARFAPVVKGRSSK